MVDLLLGHETFLTHRDEHLEHHGVLLPGERHPDQAGLNLTWANFLL